MSRLLLITLIVCTLFACNPVPPQSTTSVTAVDPEEYALFSAVIKQNVVSYNPEGSVVICDQTKPHLDNLEMALEGPFNLPEELVEAYRLRNDQPYTLDTIFTLQQTYELMPQSEYDSLLRTGGTSWADFEAKYPQAEGVFIVSRAGLNAARDEALVSIGYYCGPLCLQGGVFLMIKEDGVWKVKRELVSWMS